MCRPGYFERILSVISIYNNVSLKVVFKMTYKKETAIKKKKKKSEILSFNLEVHEILAFG